MVNSGRQSARPAASAHAPPLPPKPVVSALAQYRRAARRLGEPVALTSDAGTPVETHHDNQIHVERQGLAGWQAGRRRTQLFGRAARWPEARGIRDLERKTGGRNVTMPARQYSVNGERRSYALLRPIADNACQDRLRDVILDAYKEHEAELAAAS